MHTAVVDDEVRAATRDHVKLALRELVRKNGTPPHSHLAPLHERAGAILDGGRWLVGGLMLLLTVACDGLLEATRVIAPSSALIYVTHGLRLSIAHPCPCTPVKAEAATAATRTAYRLQ